MRSLLLVIFLTVCLTYIFFSFHAVLYYFTQILPDLLTSWKGDYYNQSVTGSVMRGVQDPTVQQIVRWGIVFLLLISLLFVFFKEKRNTKELVNLKISAVIVFSLLVNSFSWQHHFVWLFIPFFIMTFYIKKLERSKKYYILLGICYLLVASNMKNPSLFPVFLQSHVFYGGILLYGINLYLLYKHKVYFLKKKK